MARNGCRTQRSLDTRRILTLAGCAALTLCGFLAQTAWTQEAAHPVEAPNVKVELQKEHSADDRSRRSQDQVEKALDKSDADPLHEKGTGTARDKRLGHSGTPSVATETPVSVPLRDTPTLDDLAHAGRTGVKPEDIPINVERNSEAPAERKLTRGLVFLDVTNRKGKISVVVRDAADSLLNENVDPLNSQEQEHAVSSSAELQDLIGDNAATVVHRGDDLPREWQQELREKSSYLRNTEASPKKSVDAYGEAVRLLERTASPERVRIFSALPNESDRSALIRQLDKMDLNSDEVDGWQRLQRDMREVQSQSGDKFKFKEASKKALLEELTNGTNDIVILIAHHDDGMIHFSNGARMSDAEWAAVSREIAPKRTLILLSCTTGGVKGRSLSLSEIAIHNRLALNVLAPEGPISAHDVPDMLGDFLIRHKSIRESFGILHAITLNLPFHLTPVPTENVIGTDDIFDRHKC